jgi:hypothetical protein
MPWPSPSQRGWVASCHDGWMDTKWDVDFAFEVGTSERHNVTFHWRLGPGEATISVDGAEVLRERHPFGMKSTRQYKVAVGRAEIHSVVVEKRKPAAWGGVRKQAFRAFVDGELVGEF